MAIEIYRVDDARPAPYLTDLDAMARPDEEAWEQERAGHLLY